MSVSGNIQTFPLTDLLQWFSITHKSGILTVVPGQYTVNILLRRGVLITAETSSASRRLGQYLLSRGFISETHLMKALDIQEDGGSDRLLGEILIEKGALTREILVKALENRTKEIVFDLFLLNEGAFHFNQNADFPPDKLMVEVNLNVDNLVLEGVRRTDDWRRFRELLPSDDVRLKLTTCTNPIEFGPDDVTPSLIQHLKEEKSIGELIMFTRRSPYQVYSSLYRLLKQKMVEVISLEKSDDEGRPSESLEQLEFEFHRLIRRALFEEAKTKLAEWRSRISQVDWLQRMTIWLEREELSTLRHNFAPDFTPELLVPFEQARNYNLTPQEGFLMSRLAEGMELRALCQIMPLAELDILRILLSLRQKGVLR